MSAGEVKRYEFDGLIFEAPPEKEYVLYADYMKLSGDCAAWKTRHDTLKALEKAWEQLARAERAFRKLVNESFTPAKQDKIVAARAKVRRLEHSVTANRDEYIKSGGFL